MTTAREMLETYPRSTSTPTCWPGRRTCGDECDGRAEHMDHCPVCAEACRRCEQLCQELLTAMA